MGHQSDRVFQVELEMLVFAEGGKPEYPEKQPKEENQQQTQPTYYTESRNQTQTTLVGGKCSTIAPFLLPMMPVYPSTMCT